jgi:hypothetical protein
MYDLLYNESDCQLATTPDEFVVSDALHLLCR